MTLKASPLNCPEYTSVHSGYSCVDMCTLNGCPDILLFITGCWGTSSRCTYLFGLYRGYSLRSNRRLLSGDAFSVFSTIRMSASMTRESLCKSFRVCVRKVALCISCRKYSRA